MPPPAVQPILVVDTVLVVPTLEVGPAGPEGVEHDRDPHRGRAAEADLGVPPGRAAIGDLLDHVLGGRARQRQGAGQRGGVRVVLVVFARRARLVVGAGLVGLGRQHGAEHAHRVAGRRGRPRPGSPLRR